MALLNLGQFPKGFAESNVLHLSRTAEVVVVKRLRNFLVPGANEPQTEFEAFYTDYFEFLTGKALLQRAKALDDKWDDPDAPGVPLYRHYYVSATSESTIGGLATSLLGTVSPKGNTDVASVSATVNVEGRGGCTIVLNSRDSKYIFQSNPFRKGRTVFDSNDLVFVTLPGLDNKPYRVFTGLVTSARVETQLGDTLLTSVVLECEDMLKLLAQSRTAVKPSANVALSGGRYFQGMAPDYSGRLPHDIMSEILSRAFCDLYTSPGFRDTLSFIREGVENEVDVTAAAVLEEQEVASRLRLPKPAVSSVSYDPTNPFMAVVSDGSQSVSPSAVLSPITTSGEAATIPSKIYGFRRMVADLNVIGRIAVPSLAAGAAVQISDPDDLAFVVEGTTQPAFKLAFAAASSLYFADWESGLGVCRRIAEDINFEFFADHAGVARFRPLNVALPKDFKFAERQLTTAQLPASSGQVGVEYWLDERFISGTPTFTDTDGGVYTVAYCCSDWQVGSQPGAPIYKGAAIDLLRFLRLGPRTAPLVQKLQLNSDLACEAYATAHLARLNGEAMTASLSYVGDARLRAGNPCYVKHTNSIYYISSVTHTFVAGRGYTTQLRLKYGRRPIAISSASGLGTITSTSLQTLTAFKTLAIVLSDLKAQGRATQLIGAVTSGNTLADYIQANQSRLTFQGYVWEPIMPLDYETLLRGLSDQKDTGARKEILENYYFNSPAFFTEVQRVQRSAVGVISARDAANAAGSNLLGGRGLA